MREKRSILIVIILFILILGGAMSGSVLASGGQRLDPADLEAISPATFTLKKSSNSIGPWSDVLGNLTVGYSTTLNQTEDNIYIQVDSLSATPALLDGLHEIYFDSFRVPDGFWAYWAAKEIDEYATGDDAIMWQILNGDLPMFYIKAASASYSLVDGYLYQTGAGESPWRVNDDLPLATYHFGGEVTDTGGGSEYLNIQITFTKQATVSITPDTSVIDGCGYVDVYIHLADVHDLYAVDIALEFDETTLEVVDMDATEDGVNLGPVDDWFAAGYWVYNEADNANGTIQYTASQLNTTDPAEGEGDIAMIRFRAKSVGSSDITITGAELSDRDGYLVGRPIALDEPAGTITTQFTAAGGLALDIIRLDNANVQLRWPKQIDDESAEYNLYRSKLPYFEIGDGTLIPHTSYDDTGNPITYTDPVLGQVGDDTYFYAYGLQITCSNEFSSPLSDQVGKIEFELFETNTRDYAWIGLVLENETILDARDLANNIESQLYSGTINVLTVGEWNLSGQNMTNYNHVNQTSLYNVFVKQPYRVEVDIDGTTSGSVIWAQVGKLPPISGGTYAFNETATTDFSWILQPLDKVNVTTTDQLASDIEDSGAVNVLAIGEWNGTGQSMTNVVPGVSSFNTRFGYPYRIEIALTNEGPVIWP